MNLQPVLIALQGGPLDGKVVEGDASEKILEMIDYDSPYPRKLIYRIDRFQAEIETATFLEYR